MTLEPEQRASLAAAVGGDGLLEHDPDPVDDLGIAATLRPGDGSALGRTLAALSQTGVGAVVKGGGTRLGLGNPPRCAAVFLSTERLVGVDVFEPGEGVCHVGAGTTLAGLRDVVETGAWELPLDPPGDGCTVGGTIAAAAFGPRAQGFGPPRDSVLGLEVALASGERTRCGGRVVKNVTGYDLCKLYTGSLGSLGVVEGAWLRLRPSPQAVAVKKASVEAEGACAAGLAAARLPTARAAVLLANGAGLHLVVELAGDAGAVERDAARLRDACRAAEAAPGALEQVRSLQAALPGTGGLRFRVTVLPSRLSAAFARLRAAGAELLVHPGRGTLWAGLGLADGDAAAAAHAFELVASTAAEAGGAFVLEDGPAWAKRGRDVFAGEAGVVSLSRALKERFDPHGILNAGRFQGFL